MWVRGKHEGLRYEAKVYPVPSSHGIDNGRVSKLEIYAPVYRFSRGDAGPFPPVTPEQIAAIVQEAERKRSWWRHFQAVAQWANQRVDVTRLIHTAAKWLLKLLNTATAFVVAAFLVTSPETPAIFREYSGEPLMTVWVGMYMAVVMFVAIFEWTVWDLDDDVGF